MMDRKWWVCGWYERMVTRCHTLMIDNWWFEYHKPTVWWTFTKTVLIKSHWNHELWIFMDDLVRPCVSDFSIRLTWAKYVAATTYLNVGCLLLLGCSLQTPIVFPCCLLHAESVRKKIHVEGKAATHPTSYRTFTPVICQAPLQLRSLLAWLHPYYWPVVAIIATMNNFIHHC